MIPTLINLVLSALIMQINLIFAGKLNDESTLVGIGLANTLIEGFPLMITLGVSSAVESLVSQAYGNKQYKLCGAFLNKQIMLVTAAFLPIIVGFYNSKNILVNVLGQNELAATECERYLRLVVPALYMDSIYDSFEIFFTAMEKSYVPLVIQIVSIPLHFVWCQLFTQQMQLGLHGIALAQLLTSTTRITGLFALLSSPAAYEIRECLVSFNMNLFTDITGFA